jgi:hypothetical protein
MDSTTLARVAWECDAVWYPLRCFGRMGPFLAGVKNNTQGQTGRAVKTRPYNFAPRP